MKHAPLIWRNLLRRKTRTIFAFLSVVIAFVLFGVLATIRVAFSYGVEVAGADRLIMIHKVSFINFLPVSYKERVKEVEGVRDATHATWFSGIYQDPSNFFAQMAVEPEEWLGMYPEYVLPGDQQKTWIADRTGAIAGRTVAERFGWNVGDRIPLQGTIFQGGTWEFTIDGIFDGNREGVDTNQLFFHNAYLWEKAAWSDGQVGWYIIRVDDPQQSAEVAQRIDALFANSPYETKTSTEKAFVQAFANQVGDIGTILTAILVAVFFTLLLVTGNTMAQSIRERTSELAVLKTLGYGNALILGLVLAESLVIAVTGGAVGLLLAWLVSRQGDPTGGLLPAFFFPPKDMVLGVALVVGLGIAAGLLPAVRAMRLKIVDALRRS